MTQAPTPARRVIEARSQPWVSFFTWIMRRRIARSFDALRIATDGRPDATPAEHALIIYSNHPAWWDPAVFIVLMDTLFPALRGFGPMDEQALARYGFMRRIGIFGIAPDSTQGARELLRIGDGLLADPRHMLWITAQGTFTDVRVRPPGLRPGLAALMRHTSHRVAALPLALEYPFWSESRPEALCRFGAPVFAHGASRAQLHTQLEQALAETQDRLTGDVVARDPERFDTLLDGQSGVGGVYDLFRRLRAGWRGESFDPRHERTPREGR